MDLAELQTRAGGVRHYWVKPNSETPDTAYDPRRPEKRRVYEWFDFEVNDFLILEESDQHCWQSASNAARQYGHRKGRKFSAHQQGSQLFIIRVS